MKKTIFLSLALFVAGSLMAAPVTVLSNKKVAQGYYPKLNNCATELTYLGGESETYATDIKTDVYVSNEDLKLVLHKNGTRTELYPHGTDINYICASISPDGQKILFKTSKGIGVCDMNGTPIANLGRYTAPVWYGNDYVVATLEENDGHNFTGGAVVILSLDGQLKEVLTDKREIAMCPTVDYESGQIAYHDFEGYIHLMQINLAGNTIAKHQPAIRKVEGIKPKIRRMQDMKQADFSNIKIYINPGHGGYDGNDRGMKVWMDTTYQDYGFWESQSNLDKGLRLDTLLRGLGFQTKMSRVLNRSEDDKDLYDIVVEANTYGADFMLSIHSNAGGPSNYVLQLFRGLTPGDTHTYKDMPDPEDNQKSYEITTLMANLQMSNKIATWSRTAPVVAGDKTFAREIMDWSNGYGVLRWLNVPGTISEGAMHDYYPETYRLMNIDYKRQEAWYFLKTFCSYYANYKQTKGVIGGQVRDAYRKQTFPSIKRIKDSRDEQIPVLRAKVELLQDGKVIDTYITDTCYNGVFFFWDLAPGKYTVRVPEGKYELRTPGMTENESYFYGKETEVEVKADEITHVDMMIDAQRSTRPEVIRYEPAITAENITDSVNVSTSVALHFNWDMKAEETAAAFSISPKVDGALTWENSYRTLRFTPIDGFAVGTEYTVTLAKSACHPDTNWDNTMAEDFSFKFRTKFRGEISLVQSYPAKDQQDVSVNPSFILIFDGAIKATTANKKAFKLMKGTEEVAINAKSFSISRLDGSITFEPTSELLPDTDYKLVMNETLVDVDKIYLNKTVEIPFRTIATAEADGVMVDDMEATSFSYNAEDSEGLKTAAAIKYTTKKLFGTASNQLKYEFNAEDSYATYTYLNPALITDANGNCQFGMYVFGDFSENELVAIWNAEGDIKYTTFGTIDFAGWKYLSADMSELPTDVAYQFMGLRLKRGTGFLSSNGFICIDNVMFVAAPTAVENVEAEKQPITKTIENNQVIIIRNGVRYNVLGTVVE